MTIAVNHLAPPRHITTIGTREGRGGGAVVSLPLGSSRLHLCPELSSSDRVLCSTDQEIKERKLSKIFIAIK